MKMIIQGEKHNFTKIKGIKDKKIVIKRKLDLSKAVEIKL